MGKDHGLAFFELFNTRVVDNLSGIASAKAYDPDQPRDDHGRFASTNGGARQWNDNPDEFPSWLDYHLAYTDFKREMYSTVDSEGNPTDAGTTSATDDYQHGLRDEYVVPDDKTLAMNRALNAGRNSTRADRIDDWVNASTLKQDLIAFRGAALPYLVADSLQPGAEVTVGGYQSHAYTEREAVSYLNMRLNNTPDTVPVLFKNTIVAGTHAADAAYSEVVVQRGTTVTITDRSEKDGMVYLTGEVRPND